MIWMALLSYRELTLAAFLTGRENQTLPTLILTPRIRGAVHHRRGGLAAVVYFYDSAGDSVLFVWPQKFSGGRSLKPDGKEIHDMRVKT